MDCRKKTFDTPELANARVCEINADNKKANDKTKLRYYLCKYCGKYHLTSTSKHGFKFKTDINYRSKIREQSFIKRESEYYEDKFKK